MTFYSLSFTEIPCPPSSLFTGRWNGSEPARTLLTQATFEPVWEPVFCAIYTVEPHVKGL